MDKILAETKFFIHDLRVDKFFRQLVDIHRTLMANYEESALIEARSKHEDYLRRLRRALEQSNEARVRYEVAVKSKRGEEAILEAGREYIIATEKTCKVALLPHWRDWRPFVEKLPRGASGRALENKFNEVKAWIGAIDRRINDFLRYADDDVPMMPMSVWTRVQTQVEERLRYYVRGAGEKRLELRLGQLDKGEIYADAPSFNRLLFNLTMNAVDAMRHKKHGVILVAVRSDKHTVALEVTDEGHGMSADKVQQILTTEKDLTGELHSLGFRFVRKTVESFNGKIFIDSIEGKGTTIRVVFPRYHAGEDELETPDEPGSDRRPSGPEGADSMGATIHDDFCRSLSPMPGCLFSVGVSPEGRVDHFAHKPYDPDWMMGHDDLAPMLYEAVIRGRYEIDEVAGVVLILKSPLKSEEYWDLRELPAELRNPEDTLKLIHDEYVLIARRLIETGMDPSIPVYITYLEQCFTAHGQSFSADPFPLRELADQKLVRVDEG